MTNPDKKTLIEAENAALHKHLPNQILVLLTPLGYISGRLMLDETDMLYDPDNDIKPEYRDKAKRVQAKASKLAAYIDYQNAREFIMLSDVNVTSSSGAMQHFHTMTVFVDQIIGVTEWDFQRQWDYLNNWDSAL